MEPTRFDALTRTLATAAASRRTALTALLAGVFAPLLLEGDGDAKRGKGRNRNRGKGRGKGNGRGNLRARRPDNRDRGRGARVRAEAACYPGSPCTPGPGKNLGKCNFADSPALKGKNLKGANLGGATVARGDASGANLTGANLDKTCLVDANLTGATVNGSTNLGTAVLCRTTMPDGTTSNAGCHRGTACCPACDEANACDPGKVCCNGRCVVGACCGNGQQSTCGDGRICCERECRDGVCCTDADCPAGTACVDGHCCNVCAIGCAFGTLEAAISGTPAGGIIRICPGVYPARDVVIAKDLTIVGAGAGADPTTDTILESNRFQNGLLVEGGVVTLRDLRVTKGHSDLNGGGIVNSANLTLRSVTVIDNTADDNGGGIENRGTLTLAAGTLVTQNRAGFQGGGIYQESGATVMQANSRVTGNETGTGHLLEKGGGIYVESGTVTVADATIVTGNTPDNCRPTGAVPNCID